MNNIRSPFEYVMNLGREWLRANTEPMTIRLAYLAVDSPNLAHHKGYDFCSTGCSVAASFRACVEAAIVEVYQDAGDVSGAMRRNSTFDTTVLGCLLNDSTKDLGYTQEQIPLAPAEKEWNKLPESVGVRWQRYTFKPLQVA
jgi:hypothetical protein